jgi:adenosylcobyric acid synthase
VGKSVLVAGLCRLLRNRGASVRPFKPQNMSNNAAVTTDGGEIGRSTALQAFACGVAPTVHMNPLLLKPQGDRTSQLIVRGQRAGEFTAGGHSRDKRALLELAVESFLLLRREADWVIVEGAGSPAETNLRPHDIANMGFAHAADVPVVLVGDIDRGHVIASLVGAHAVLNAADRARVRGFLINKFRGDPTLFEAGLTDITAHTGWPSFGMVRWLAAARDLPAEDAVQLTSGTPVTRDGRVHISVVRLPHIANFDDFDPLLHEPHVQVEFIDPAAPLPMDSSLLILPGSKSTVADLRCLLEHGWLHDLHAYARRGGRILGICAGLQMLGQSISDPHRIESDCESINGFGLLDLHTSMTPRKMLRWINPWSFSTMAVVMAPSLPADASWAVTCTDFSRVPTIGAHCWRLLA